MAQKLIRLHLNTVMVKRLNSLHFTIPLQGGGAGVFFKISIFRINFREINNCLKDML